jgi:hypothetical protein
MDTVAHDLRLAEFSQRQPMFSKLLGARRR